MAQNKWADKQDRAVSATGAAMVCKRHCDGSSTGEGREIAAGGAGEDEPNEEVGYNRLAAAG